MNTETNTAAREKSTITFVNHPPVRIFDDSQTLVYRAPQEWGHHVLWSYTAKNGKVFYWSSYRSGMEYGGRPCTTTRKALKSAAAIKEAFGPEIWHADLQEVVEPESIIDLTI